MLHNSKVKEIPGEDKPLARPLTKSMWRWFGLVGLEELARVGAHSGLGQELGSQLIQRPGVQFAHSQFFGMLGIQGHA